jgi:hypothetical protein
MRRLVRYTLLAVAGLLASAVFGIAYLRALSGEGAVGRILDTAYMTPGYWFSAPFGYSACPFFRHVFGWSGPGGAYMQMLLVAFLTWSIIFTGIFYLWSALRARTKT